MLRTLPLTLVFAMLIFTETSLPRPSATTPNVRRITTTSEEVLNINPSISNDGRFIAFESTFDLAGAGGNGFHALRTAITAEPILFEQIGNSRAVTPALSQNGSHIAFASTDDPLGTNNDGNSEIFLYRQGVLLQLTNTTATEITGRTTQGNFNPSITDEGRFIAFSSNRNLANQNSDSSSEVFLCDTTLAVFTQFTDVPSGLGARDAKISGDGSAVAYVHDVEAVRRLILQERNGGPPQLIAEHATLSLASGRVISADGSRVVYSAEMTPGATQVFLWDGRQNITRQLTQLDSREDDVPLNATISGDGKRVAFATRRNVIGGNSDHSVELYVVDIPSGQVEALTNAPASATAEIVSSLNEDGSFVTFNFPRVIGGPVSSSAFANNSEIFLANTAARPLFGSLSVANGAAHETESTSSVAIAPESIVVATGNALAHTTQEAQRLTDKTFPFTVAGTSVTVNGRNAQIFFVSPGEVNFVVPAATEMGLAEVIVTNSDGFRSRGQISVEPTAPGIFSTNGQFDDGVVLNADTLQEGPFDPTEGMLRLTIFATGVRRADFLFVASTSNHRLVVESVNASPELPGLDEIHVLVPSGFRGAERITLVVRANDRVSNPFDVTFTGAVIRDLVINEVLADPPDGLAGDANGDGVRSSSEDEFVELVNNGSALNISGWTIRTRGLGVTSETTRHTFASGTVLLAGEVVVVFGGGDFDPVNQVFGCSRVVRTTSAGLSLVNGGLTLVVRDSNGALVTEFTYGDAAGLEGDNNQSLTRSPDIFGNFVQHSDAAGAQERHFSPGLKTDGTPLVECLGSLHAINLSRLATTINIGATTNILARPVDIYGRSMPGVSVSFTSDNTAVASIDSVFPDESTGTFTATITGHAAGVAHITALATDGATAVMATATVTVTSPATPLLVINQVYGGGNNSGATFQSDFVELFNRGTTVVDFSVTPYSLQYASANGNFTNANKLNLTSGSLAPGQYFLIRLAGGTTNGVPLPTADASSTGINLAAADGKVALVLGTNVLAGSGCPLTSAVADFVGYGAANCAEGTAVGALSATKSARRNNRCSDTDSNLVDFGIVTNPSSPQNSTAPHVVCP